MPMSGILVAKFKPLTEAMTTRNVVKGAGPLFTAIRSIASNERL